MPRLTEETRQARRTHIIEAALRCFSRKGFAATSMADIIAEAEASSGSIYSHFKSKEDILRAALDLNVSQLEALLTSRAQEGGVLTPRELLTYLARGNLAYSNPGMLVKLWAELGSAPALKNLAAEAIERMRTVLTTQLIPWAHLKAPEGCIPEQYAKTATDKVLVVLHGYTLRITIDSTVNPTVFLADVEAMLPR